MAVAERIAVIPLVVRAQHGVRQAVDPRWWQFGKSAESFADLIVDPSSPRA
jgi:hypothetical protein